MSCFDMMCHLMIAHLKCILYDTTQNFCQAIIFSLMGHRPISPFSCIIRQGVFMKKQNEDTPRGKFTRKTTVKPRVSDIRPVTIRSMVASSSGTHLQYDDGEWVAYEEDVLCLFNHNPLRTSPDREDLAVTQ